mmetsp:Transcript_4909/g.7244  ORF Transcript_4909/g.7244 Transcript_4909/m.7244 type:complete len:547 (-) Transcript_4909:781-2421(-)
MQMVYYCAGFTQIISRRLIAILDLSVPITFTTIVSPTHTAAVDNTSYADLTKKDKSGSGQSSPLINEDNTNRTDTHDSSGGQHRSRGGSSRSYSGKRSTSSGRMGYNSYSGQGGSIKSTEKRLGTNAKVKNPNDDNYGAGKKSMSVRSTATSTRLSDSNTKSKASSNSSSSKSTMRTTSGTSKRTGGSSARSSGKTTSSSRSGGGGRSSSGGRGSSGGHGSGCFPGDSLVEVKKGGQIHKISLQNLKIGEEVRTGSDSFSEVYAFGTRHASDGYDVPMLRIHTDSGSILELTDNHLVFIKKSEPKPDIRRLQIGHGLSDCKATFANHVRVGDELILVQDAPDWVVHDEGASSVKKKGSTSTSTVINIESVIKREGLYHPLTYDGRIVVNGILASVHATDGIAPFVHFGGIQLVDIHALQQYLFSPLRVMCMISFENFCAAIYQHDAEDGSHHYLSVMEALQMFLFPQVTNDGSDDEEEAEVNVLEWSPQLPLRLWLPTWIVLSCILEWILLRPSLATTIVFLLASLLLLQICVQDRRRRRKGIGSK